METTQKMQNLEFRVFEGPSYEQMPKLIAAGLVPAGAAQIMCGRLEGKLSFDENYHSGDVIVYHPDGRVKLVWDSQDLRRLHLASGRRSGALVLPNGVWESLDGYIPSEGDLVKYTDVVKKQLNHRATENPFWRWLARGDQGLLGEYADRMVSHAKSRGYLSGAMAVYLGNPKMDVLALRLWRLSDANFGGFANGSNNLINYDVRLVGVPEMQGISGSRNHPALS